MSEVTAGRHENASVLIVEDEALIAFFLEDTLDELGYPCCGVAGSADEALCLAEAQSPALAFVDIGLRGSRDGIAVATELASRGIVVVFLTGSNDAETRRRVEAVQPHGILAKPCNHRDIANMLESARHSLSET